MILFITQCAIAAVGLLLEGALDFLLADLPARAAAQNAREFEHADPNTIKAWRHFPF